MVVAACPFPERRGTPVRIQRLAEGVQRRGHDVRVVTYPFGSGTLDARMTVYRAPRAGARYRAAPGPSPGKLLILDPLLVRLLRRVLREWPADVIHAHHYEGLLIALAARVGRHVPLIYDAHMLLESELPSYGRRLPEAAKRSLGRTLDRWLPARADHVISVTDTIRDTLLERTRLRQDQVTTVANGVEYELFAVRGRGEVGERAPIVVFTGNLARYQGIDLLLRAFRSVLAELPAARLRIVTESSFDEYESLARGLGVREAVDVIRTGFEDVPALLAGADVAVNPRADCHGIPLKLLNYMAASKPVVSFRESAPGVEHGRTGWIVEKGDIAGLSEGILTLLRDPERAHLMGEAARAQVIAHHSWAAASEMTERVYRGVLERSARGRRRPSVPVGDKALTPVGEARAPIGAERQ